MRGAVVALLALTVGLVLADSAVVTLALPDILDRLGGTVAQVAWVLIAFNLVLALVVVPAARSYARHDPAPLCAGGITVFAAASLGCALASSIGVLIAARCVQALGGAFALVGCLELLVEASGERRGVTRWVAAGVVGTAAGPVAGGLLTDAFAWQSIFIVQVPIAVFAVPAAFSLRGGRIRSAVESLNGSSSAPPAASLNGSSSAPPSGSASRHRPAAAPNVALVLLSAALTAALFLLVLLLVDGWRRSPATAALTVSVMPVAAFLARPLARRLPTAPGVETATGCLLIAGGLVSLALPPAANLTWTIGPQALVGLGLGLTVDRLTLDAMRGRLPRALHGGWTIAARHLGVVLGLVILTPVFTADLESAQVPAEQAITRLVLDAPLAAQSKVDLAQGLSDELTDEHGRIPDLHPVFATLQLSPAQRPAAAQLERDLDSQLERAATRAFRNSFLVGAALALAALASLIPLRRRTKMQAPR